MKFIYIQKQNESFISLTSSKKSAIFYKYDVFENKIYTLLLAHKYTIDFKRLKLNYNVCLSSYTAIYKFLLCIKYFIQYCQYAVIYK